MAAAAGAPAQGVDGAFLQMFSQSLASTFNIASIIPGKYDGDPEKYTEFRLLWTRADQQMAAMGFTFAQRLWELRKVLDGPALAYVQGLPSHLDRSYEEAMQILDKLYAEKKNTLRGLIRNLLISPQSSGSVSDRQKFHAGIVAYYQGINAVNASDRDSRFAIELSLIEAKMDEGWRREWFKFCSRKKDMSPLGAAVTENDLIRVLYESLVQQINMLQSREIRGKKDGTRQSAAPAIAATANATVAGKFNQKSGGGGGGGGKGGGGKKANSDGGGAAAGGADQKKEPCPFCSRGGYNEYKHTFPMKCPLVHPKSTEKKLSRDELFKIVKKRDLCRNCFGPHKAANCDAPEYCKCKECGKRHHTLLHPPAATSASATSAGATAAAAPIQD